MKKIERLKIYEEIRDILSSISQIPPFNETNFARKELASKAINEVVKPCAGLLDKLLWAERFGEDLEEDGFYDDLEEIKEKLKLIMKRLDDIDSNPVTA